jgi:hypothetical protein
VDREALIAELQNAGVKHNADDILRIAKKPDGTIVFLERGNLKSGLQHILHEHAAEFIDRGIPQEQISDAVMSAVINGRMVGTQGKNRIVYEVDFNGLTQYISVSVSTNGYIVGANPAPRKLIRRSFEER